MAIPFSPGEIPTTSPKPSVALCGNEPWQIQRVFGRGRRERLEDLADLHLETVNKADFPRQAEGLRRVEALFSTWGMDEELALLVRELPGLKAFFYAAGSVRHFASPLLERGITVVSAWAANAVPVAQFTLAQVLLSLKGYFRNARETRLAGNRGSQLPVDAPGVCSESVALLGCGMVGRKVAGLLAPFGLELLAYDPFLADADAAALGIRKVTLEEAFSRAYVISNHLADLPATRGLLQGGLFARMRPGAAFINTGRGATVSEAGLVEVLRARGDLTALLDVTHPEPPAADSPLYGLENVHLSSHIAGSLGGEVVRMADDCLEEFAAWRQGRPLRYQVTLEMLHRMA